GYTFIWEQGRQLADIKGNSKDISFKYNVDGIRTEKTINGVTTKYHLVGDKVTFEDNGTDKIYYTYDDDSNLVSMNLNGTEYYYVRNAQGDIIGLFDKTGAQVVSYTYDSWGKLVSIDGTMKDSVGFKNPYRYRGYRYDSETGLYYLQSRYYNPEWGRFINADGIIGQTGELLGHNLFMYCKNNCVNGKDPSGFRMVFADDETQRAYDDWVWVQHQTQVQTKTTHSSIIPNGNQSKSVARSALVTGVEGGVSSILSKVPDAIPFAANRAVRRAGHSFAIPIKGASSARAIGSIEKIGAIGVALTGLSVWDNYHSGYSKSEAFGRSALDVGVSAAVIGIGLFTPVGWTVAIGFGLGIVSEGVKNYIWKKD
ncbi:MAG: RHS repeat-associated core domain-containing protein, partial [Clostridium sp.]|nr:RHS repeat-associated core domain-containing protein [Clostridium sp.]